MIIQLIKEKDETFTIGKRDKKINVTYAELSILWNKINIKVRKDMKF